jgi:hypothetical protein
MPAAPQRIGEIESRLERLEARVDALGVELRASDDETRRLLRESEDETRRQVREGDEETRRQMRILHEDVIDRIRILGEHLAAPLPPSVSPPLPPQRRKRWPLEIAVCCQEHARVTGPSQSRGTDRGSSDGPASGRPQLQHQAPRKMASAYE